MSDNQGVTILDYIVRYRKVQEVLFPILKKTLVAKLLGKKFDTVAKRMASKSFIPEDIVVILNEYREQLGTDQYRSLLNIVTEEYDLVEQMVTEKVLSLPISLQEFGKASGINYNKIMGVTQGRERWTVPYLEKIGEFLEELSQLKYL